MRMGKLIDKPWKVIALIALEGIVAGIVGVLAIQFLPSPTGEAVYNAMLVLFLSGGGITVIVYGNVIKNSNFYILGFGFLLLALFVVIDRYEGFAVKISAFATLIMAFAAFVSIYVNIGEGRRDRQDRMKREERDRREGLVDETAKWLRELEDNILPKYSEIMSGVDDLLSKMRGSPEIPQKKWEEMYSRDEALVEGGKVDGGIKEAEYYQKLTLGLSEELSGLIGIIANVMKQRTEMLLEGLKYPTELSRKEERSKLVTESIKRDDRSLEGLGLSARDIINIRLGRNANAIRESIRKALDKIIELKTSLIEIR